MTARPNGWRSFFARQLRLTRANASRLAMIFRRPGPRRLALWDIMRHGELVAPAEAVQMARGLDALRSWRIR